MTAGAEEDASELDPEVARLLELMRRSGAKALADSTLDEARATAKYLGWVHGEPVEVAAVTERTIPGPGGQLSLRIYRPVHEARLPVLAFFHGGGFVVGDLDISDRPCRLLALQSGCVVVSVDYRLAPEHPYPAAVMDAYAAVEWIAANLDELGGVEGQIGVAGDSAGGTLAAVAAMIARDRGGPALALQLLIYPVTDLYENHPSRAQHAHGAVLRAVDIERFTSLYLPDTALAAEPYCSPLRASDYSGLPPAIIITAGHDPLRDEGTAYATALRRAGGDVRLLENPGMIHGFWSFPGALEHAHTTNRIIAEHIAELLSRSAARPA